MNIQRDDVGIVPYGGKLYTVANNYPAVGTGVLDCPFMVNFTRTVWKPVPTIIIANIPINYNLAIVISTNVLTILIKGNIIHILLFFAEKYLCFTAILRLRRTGMKLKKYIGDKNFY